MQVSHVEYNPADAGPLGIDTVSEQETNGLGYKAAYADWRRDPQAWWAQAAEGIDWLRRWDACSMPSQARTAAGSPARE